MQTEKGDNDRLVIEPVRPGREGRFATPIAEDEDAFTAVSTDEGDEEWVW